MQLADGTRRELQRHELRKGGFVRISSRIEGNGIHRKEPLDNSPIKRTPKWTAVLAINAAALVLIVLVIFWKRRSRIRE